MTAQLLVEPSAPAHCAAEKSLTVNKANSYGENQPGGNVSAFITRNPHTGFQKMLPPARAGHWLFACATQTNSASTLDAQRYGVHVLNI